MRFEKWHALGNAYLLVTADDAGTMSVERVRRLCDGHTGIGSDGILEILERDGQGAAIRIWNPDGSVAEMSGNGTRIAAAWLFRESGASNVEIRTGARTVRAETAPKGLVRQSLGEVTVAADLTLDVAGERLVVIPVELGNPHAVVLRDELSGDDLRRLGPALESHPAFPDRTNVQLARPDHRDAVSVLVWERGAGETRASGSSAAAVAAVAIARGWCDSPVRIGLPGGDLLVTIDGRQVTIEGPAEETCRGTTEL